MRKTSWIIAFAIVFSGTYANADNFRFSFTNTLSNVPGTVTGEIVGLTNNATGPASQVIITSYPAGLSPFEAPPFDAVTWSFQQSNVFSVASGQIVEANFWAFDYAPGACATVVVGVCAIVISSHDGFYALFSNQYRENEIIALAVASEEISYGPVPEPSSAFLMSTALIAVACVGRKRTVQGLHPTSY